MSKKLFTQKDIIQLKKQFTKDDLQLAKWLQICPDELIEILLKILCKQFTNAVITDCFLQDHQLTVDHPLVKPELRMHLSVLMVSELKRYAAHSFHFRSPRPGYGAILTQVIKNVSEKKGHSFKNLPETIADKELFLTQLVLADTRVRSATTADKIFQKSIVYFLKASLKKVSPQIIKRFTPAVGWALLAKDIYDFGGEAARVTTPFVIQIAMYKVLELKMEA